MSLLKKWNQFWFNPIDLTGVVFTRLVFGLTLFFTYIFRFENLNMLTVDALTSRENALLLYPEIMRPAFSWNFWPDSWSFFMHILFCLLILLWTFGVGGRFLGVLVWVLHMGFIQRNFSIVFGADIMAAVFLFYLIFIKTPVALKNFSIIRNPKLILDENLSTDFISSAFFRLLQIQLAVIYAYTGFEKLKGTTWWDGTALWSVLANPQMVWMDLSFVKHIAIVLPFIAFGTIIFEIYFPASMMNKKTRYPWLIAGFLFHVGIAFLMQLWSFSFVMISIYFLYIEKNDLKKMGHTLLNYFRNQ